ncbi:unnamed protein product [Closterium sp. NIES-54]
MTAAQNIPFMDQHDYSVRGCASSRRVDEAASEAAASIAMRHLPADPATILRGVPFVPAGEQRLLPSLEIARSRLETSGGDLNFPPNPWNLPVGASAGVVVPFGAENTTGRVVPAAAHPHSNPPRNEERSSVYHDLPGSAAELSLHAALPLSLAAATTAVGVGSPLQLAPRVTSRGAPPPLVLACGQDEQQRHSAAGARSSSREQAQEAPLIGFPSSLIHAMKAGVAAGHSGSSPAAGPAIGSRGGRQGTAAGRTSAASVQWGSGLALSQPALPPAREIRFALLGEREAAGEEDRGAGKGSGAAGEARGGGGGEGGGQEGLKGLFGLGQAEAPGAQGMAALVAYQRRDDPCSGAAAPLHSAFPQPSAAAASASAVAGGGGGAAGAGDLRRTLRGSLGGEVQQEGSNCLGGAFLSLGFPGTSAAEGRGKEAIPLSLFLSHSLSHSRSHNQPQPLLSPPFQTHRPYRSPPLSPFIPPSSHRICQVDTCDVELTSHKDYYRRHRVCEAHAKATHVHIQGKAQRFCQQCSRYELPRMPGCACCCCMHVFHDLCEFDDSRRSCRRRLLGHNHRRRKQQHQPLLQGTPPPQQPLAQAPPQQQQQQTSSSSTPFFPRTRHMVEGKEVAVGITAAAVAPQIPSLAQAVSHPTTPRTAATATANAAASERTSGPTAREPVPKPPFASLTSLSSAAAVQAGSSGGGGDPLCGRPVRQFSAMSGCGEAGQRRAEEVEERGEEIGEERRGVREERGEERGEEKEVEEEEGEKRGEEGEKRGEEEKVAC